MRSAIIILTAVAVSVVAYAQIVVNEVMFNPSGSPENEWFELYNVSDSDVDLSGWLWSDSSYSGSPTPITEDEHIISAGGYVIVSKEAWGTPPSCDVIIPSTWRSLNNSGYDEVIVFSPDTEIVEKVIYVESEHGCGEDISLERIDPFGSSTDQSNWGCCDDPSGNTACGENSIHSEPVPIDLAITSLTIDPENPEPDELFSILVDVRNNGTETATGFNLYVKYVSGSDTTDVGSEPLEDISSGASVGKEFSLSLSAGTYTIIAEVDDTVGSNNTQTYSLTIVEPGAVPQIRISEIMFKPAESSKEWIELFNAGTTDVDIANWTIADPAYSGTITSETMIISPGDYIIITEFDTTFSCTTILCDGWPYLNNDGDSIFLRDGSGMLVDQCVYEVSGTWDSDVSYERYNIMLSGADPSNWLGCEDEAGSTPCAPNSVAPLDYDVAISSITTDPQNPLPEQDFTLNVWVKNVGLFDVPPKNVSLYLDMDENEIYSSADSLIGSGTTSELAAGESTSVDFVLNFPAGLVKLVAVVDDTAGDNNEYYRTVVVADSTAQGRIIITEIMFKPEVSSEEWIELYNDGDGIVDIANWTIADPSGEYTITTSSTPIAPGDYLIIAEFDTNFSCNTIYCSDWPWLNNSGDSLWLRDGDGNVVDQAAYEAGDDWDYGVSAEITSPSADGAVVSSWGASRSADGSTPCEDNSLWSMPQGEKLSVNIEPNPFDPQLENAEIIVGAPADVDVQVHIYDLRGKLIKDFGSVFSTTWDGKDEYGNDVPTGAYILVVQTEKDGKKEYKKFPVAVARGMR